MLPFAPPLEPMLAKLVSTIPEGAPWLYEPKWDGFRTLVFRDGPDVRLQSRDLKLLDRYFPELVEPVRASLPLRCVVDGEIVIVGESGLDFPALLQRIHPAESRVARLARETPASLVVWDLLALGDRDLRAEPLGERRRLLEAALAGVRAPVHLTPATRDAAVARDWFTRFEGAGLDGVVAKRLDGSYRPGVRAMEKIKHARTADCAVGGFRRHKDGRGVGSLLLGLYDAAGVLHHVGVASSFDAATRKALVAELEPLRAGAASGHPWLEGADEAQRRPGAQSRWSRGKDLSWEPVRVERVCEVAYDHLEGDRFRHATHFVRWRPDKPARACGYEQLEERAPAELGQIFG